MRRRNRKSEGEKRKVVETLCSIAMAGMLGVLGMAAVASAQTPPLAKESPFIPTGEPATAAPAAALQLVGVAVTSSGSRVCIYEAKAGHSRWISVGMAADGIQVIGYDGAQKQAVISVDGKRQTLVLHESATAADLSVPTTPEAKAREARLLTGDLLDIGMEQRQAYADAKKTAGQ